MQTHYEFGHIWVTEADDEIKAELFYSRSKAGKGFEITELRKTADMQDSGIERQLMAGMMDYLKSQLWDWIDSYQGRPFLSADGRYDVMGFMQDFYGEVFGVDITDNLTGMVDQMTAVPLDALIPGDAVFWGLETEPHQVAIYLGGGKIMTVAVSDGKIIEQALQRYDQPSFARTLR
ncbi:cell wall-associated hydrolase [Weissella oryzae SG25]|uniref:Cell wall-associated hydrolase n=1 Tax=Weissella oryzae (strain DSM 25784 / JCM 18191 / LMG 30913 / SG25) TaxID=1329250 RepID=A0A069CUC1_WEIOS|nr:NlpC/P60 family protein [Weissella oryzae]GAK31395.1 cell wall-associated hydrolase [Weissella oryzae SG25]